jgi:hypothetical protein
MTENREIHRICKYVWLINWCFCFLERRRIIITILNKFVLEALSSSPSSFKIQSNKQTNQTFPLFNRRATENLFLLNKCVHANRPTHLFHHPTPPPSSSSHYRRRHRCRRRVIIRLVRSPSLPVLPPTLHVFELHSCLRECVV